MTSLKLLFGAHSSGYGGNDYVDYGAYTGGYGAFGYLSTTMQSTKMQPCHFENASGSVCYLSYKQIIFPSRLFDFSLAIVSFRNSSHYWCRRVVFYINYVFSGYVHVLRQIGMITLQITKRRKVTMRSIKCKGLKTVEDHNLMGLRKFMYVW